MRVDRDSVAAGDDVESHEEQRTVDGRKPLERFVSDLVWSGYLPAIGCWILRKSRRGEALGVVRLRYGRFDGLRLLRDDFPDLSEVGGSLFFEYTSREDPDEAFARLTEAP